MRTLLLTTLLACLLLGAATSVRAGDSENRYADRVIVVTGTSSGLGRELAVIAIERGMRLVLVDKNPGPSKAMAAAVREAGGEAVFVQVDLADPAQRPRVIEAAMEAFGRIDYLFNNAGYSYLALLEQMDLAEAHRLFEVNYWAYVDLAQRVIPIMREQGGGTIMNVASILGVRPSPPGLGHYAATKHALVGMFQAAAREVADDGIRVFVAAPAGMRTNIARNSTGPLADGGRDRADDWEDPAIPAADIFELIEGDEVVVYPGYIGDVVASEGAD
ncbi:MAG: SDR family NAD(P)-dependent oxidoreductase [Pseudomonadales bacterium]|jgi:NAD(P)-dependent dehydrogenase (short-subunit alcohol dehydrogenase family)|nr:SDR family NAD(P)-dependent oxidoreductase [Pseudomonadales bacterium]